MASHTIEEVAASLGISENALRLYLAASSKKDPQSVTITDSQIADLEHEISERQKGMKLDDLAKTALSIDWLSKAASSNSHDVRLAAEKILDLEDNYKRVSEKVASQSELINVVARLDQFDKAIEDANVQIAKMAQGEGAKAMSMVAQVQDMVERQGRDADKLRSEITSLKAAIESLKTDLDSLAKSQASFIQSLRAALIGDPVPAVPSQGKSLTQEPELQQPTETKGKQEPTPTSDKPSIASKDSESKESAPKPATKRFENSAPDKPSKFGVKREIEYNFLYERMGYQRPDQYPHGFTGEIKGPSDDEIRQFLAQFELGCTSEEVDMLIVHRGEYQMVQYQRIESGGGFKNWIPSKRR